MRQQPACLLHRAGERNHLAPDLAYITPAAETVKSRDLQGRAYIDFPVNVTEIRADYRGNAVELAKIRATIDSVRQDKDITLTSLSIKGFASPEGSYAANERLARGRTLSLKSHVEKLYAFPKASSKLRGRRRTGQACVNTWQARR